MTTTSIIGTEFSAAYYDQTDWWDEDPNQFDFEAAKSYYHAQIEIIFDALTGASLSLSIGEVIVDADSPPQDYEFYIAAVANAARQALEELISEIESGEFRLERE